MWRKVLLVMSVVLALQGLTWTVFGSFEPFGVYDTQMAEAFFGTSTLPPDAATAFAFALVPFGATDAAYFGLVAFVVHHGFPTRERWTWEAVSASFGLWFVVDTALSILLFEAWFNVLMVNLPCLLLFGLPLARLRAGFH